MRYQKIDGLNKEVSRIIAGTAFPAAMSGSDCGGLFDQMYEAGINTFDAARVYEKAEMSLGRWIYERNLRKEVIILSKCGHPDRLWHKRVNEKEMRKDFRQSTEMLQTDYIDLYLLHRDDSSVPAGEIVEIFNALYAEGKIKAFGGSNWTHQRIEEANEYAYKHSLIPFVVSSPYYGLAEQVQDPWGGNCVSIAGAAGKTARQWYQKNQMPVLAYSSLARGFFAGKLQSAHPEQAKKQLDKFAIKGYLCEENIERLRRCEQLAAEKEVTVAQIALAWLLCQEENTFAIMSTSNPERMQSNIKALELDLTREECQYLEWGIS